MIKICAQANDEQNLLESIKQNYQDIYSLKRDIEAQIVEDLHKLHNIKKYLRRKKDDLKMIPGVNNTR